MYIKKKYKFNQWFTICSDCDLLPKKQCLSHFRCLRAHLYPPVLMHIFTLRRKKHNCKCRILGGKKSLKLTHETIKCHIPIAFSILWSSRFNWCSFSCSISLCPLFLVLWRHPTGDLAPPAVYLNAPNSPTLHNSGMHKCAFTFYSAVFRQIWFKFEQHLDRNLAGELLGFPPKSDFSPANFSDDGCVLGNEKNIECVAKKVKVKRITTKKWMRYEMFPLFSKLNRFPPDLVMKTIDT